MYDKLMFLSKSLQEILGSLSRNFTHAHTFGGDFEFKFSHMRGFFVTMNLKFSVVEKKNQEAFHQQHRVHTQQEEEAKRFALLHVEMQVEDNCKVM